MKKYTTSLLLFLVLLATPVTAQAMTSTQGLTADQVNTIIQLLQSFNVEAPVIEKVKMALGAAPPATEKRFCHTFNKDLTVGSRGDDVAALAQALKISGITTTGDASKFSENNAGDVVAFQAKYGIRQTGYVGPLTRAKLNALHRCQDGESSSLFPKQTPPKECPSIVTPACVGKAIIGADGCKIGWRCQIEEVPSTTISEQVKCVFSGATTEQKCWGSTSLFSTTGETEPAHYGCSGVGTCVATVTAPKGAPPVSWGSSCGGSMETKIDGSSDYAYFSCGTSTSNAGY